ncbi:MAG: glycosyltransferase family 4 protein, partial [Candidatus Acidiferrales bacterium]
MRDRGHDPVIFIGGDGIFARQLRERGLQCHSIPHLVQPVHPYNDALAFGEIIAALRRFRPELVCTHTAKAGWLGRAAARLCGIPSVFTPHGWSMVDRRTCRERTHLRWAEIIASNFSSKIINVCEFERDLARGCGIGPDHKLEVVMNGIPDVGLRERANAAVQPPTVVMVARYEKPKDHKTLLYALAGIRNLEWKLILVGGGSGEADARRMARDLMLNDRIQFLSSSNDVPSTLALSQIFVLTSNFEAFPLSILEAMRAALPVVATDVGGVRESVCDGKTGILVPKGGVHATREALRLLIGAPELRNRMGAAGRAFYESSFTEAHMVARTMKIYEATISSRRVHSSVEERGGSMPPPILRRWWRQALDGLG